MDMAREQREKLKRYLINADPFLWGVLEQRNKKGRLKELKKMGFLGGYSEKSNATYSRINQDLLIELDLEGILKQIVIPKVRQRIGQESLSGLRRFWDQGEIPSRDFLKDNKLYKSRVLIWKEETELKAPGHIFLQIDVNKNFVERWTVLAGLWFEEIEPWLEKEGGQELIVATRG